jgi:hypothetical protein
MATSAFGKAFREARASGDKNFTFNGKKYNTNLASDEAQSVGGTLKAGEYVPRDAATRKGETATAKNAKPRREPNPTLGESYEADRNAADVIDPGDMRTQEIGRTRGKPAENYSRNTRTGATVKMLKDVANAAAPATFRKGGYVKAADGIAQRGKTRGKMR